jgi:hypothetical protein
MVIEKTYKLEIQGRIFTLTESEAKALYLSLKDSFKEVDTTISQPSQDGQLPSGS